MHDPCDIAVESLIFAFVDYGPLVAFGFGVKIFNSFIYVVVCELVVKCFAIFLPYPRVVESH
jgi:hypothetical protein